MTDTADWAEETEDRLLASALEHVDALGWSPRLIELAAQEAGLSAAEASLLLPEGPRDLAALLARRHDRRALATLTTLDFGASKIRDRIRRGVLAWVVAAMEHPEATRRWLGFLALPGSVALAFRLAWASADALWRWAGDRATDENHYTKRILLTEILTTTLAVRLASGEAAAEAHLDGRIAAVMAFETWKAGIRPADFAGRAVAVFARLRYGRAAQTWSR